MLYNIGGKAVNIPTQQELLEAARQAGISFDVSCEQQSHTITAKLNGINIMQCTLKESEAKQLAHDKKLFERNAAQFTQGRLRRIVFYRLVQAGYIQNPAENIAVVSSNIIATNNIERMYEWLGRLKQQGKNPRWCAVGNYYIITTTPILNQEKQSRGIQIF